MKKVFAILFASMLVTGFIACGPSAEEVKADSLLQESLIDANNQTADDMIAEMERQNDSAAKADSIAAAAADTTKK